jgi:hypothetical protein
MSVLSSTSNSEARLATRAIAVLLAGLALYCLGLELVTHFGFSRISRNQRRVSKDLQAARALPPPNKDGVPTMLVVGNSLLLDGVDRASLRQELASNYFAALLPIENTQYEDWYFGLRRLFSEGARPKVVVVCLSTRQLMSRATDSEYFARYLMQMRDLLAVKRESQLDNTMTSAYFFANRSDWLGGRAQIRNWLLQEIMPNLERLIGFFPGKTAPMPAAEQVVAGALPHLSKLDQICKENGVHLVVVVPPTLSRDDASAEVKAAAAGHGISVLIPLRTTEVTPQDFHDGFHLNQRGAARFTQSLEAALLESLANR